MFNIKMLLTVQILGNPDDWMEWTIHHVASGHSFMQDVRFWHCFFMIDIVN